LHTYSIRLTGIVQGVGFRPFVYQSAVKYGLKGTVSNGSEGVSILINTKDKKDAIQFLDLILESAPKLSVIEKHEVKRVTTKTFKDFTIVESTALESPSLPLTPDYALCDDCREDLRSSDNRRYRYGFTTCTNCGPRYSIIQELPYDRERTTMRPYTQCDVCQQEYGNPLDRRHFSQTNSCLNCGIHLQLRDLSSKQTINAADDEAIDHAVRLIQDGKILAVKGIGGYLLLCNAVDEEIVRKLRDRKHRPNKPLAVMYQDVLAVESAVELSDCEREMLLSVQSPILLLRKKTDIALAPGIAPGLDSIGVMLPYAPLLQLIIDGVGNPLVATSANLTGSPIIYEDEAFSALSSIADYALLHDRRILVPQDDSVVRFSAQYQQRIILRRSRGWAPNYLPAKDTLNELDGCLATGAQMKSAFALVKEGRCYISQYLGNLDSWHSQEVYRSVMSHLSKVTGFVPNVIISDKHPAYFGNEFAAEAERKASNSLSQAFHHRAHFAALLGERELLNSKHTILGFVWDGTGLGEDGQIWGSETFSYSNGSITHQNNLGYYRVITGDKMAMEPRIPLLTLSHKLGRVEGRVKKLFTSTEWNVYNQQLEMEGLRTSSMGRLFDAVFCLLTGKERNTYEGESAMLLESMAQRSEHFKRLAFSLNTDPIDVIFSQVLHWYDGRLPSQEVAWLFHRALVDWIAFQAETLQASHLAFSGGVFQNALLVDLLHEQLSKRFSLYFHKELSPNDENIAFGQLILHLIENRPINKKGLH
jgi:hydrogenase maturation protein HypF